MNWTKLADYVFAMTSNCSIVSRDIETNTVIVYLMSMNFGDLLSWQDSARLSKNGKVASLYCSNYM